MKVKGFCITKIIPYSHSLRSQWEVGFIFILSPFLMPCIKLCCPSKQGTSRRVGSSWTQLISRMENEMFRRVLANCCIFSNRLRSCEKLLEEERACSLPVFYRQNKRRHIKRISHSITDKKRRVLGLRRLFYSDARSHVLQVSISQLW